MAAGVLLFDEQDRVLLVDPTYKPGWEFPGGVVEPGEAPARAGHARGRRGDWASSSTRCPRLLVVDWEPPAPPGYGGLRLLFDGGTARRRGRPARLLLPGAELRGWRFVTEEEAADLLPPVRYERLRWALRARERGRRALPGGRGPARLTPGPSGRCDGARTVPRTRPDRRHRSGAQRRDAAAGIAPR